MKILLTLSIFLALALSGIGAKYTFDLSKGPVVFQYSTTGAYNPIRVTIIGQNGFAQTIFETLAYKAYTTIESVLLDIYQIATVAKGTELNVNSLSGRLSFQAQTAVGTFTITVEASGGNIKVTVDPGAVEGDPREIEIRTAIYANAELGQVIIEDSRPGPTAQEVASQQLGIPQAEAESLVDQCGAHRLLTAVNAAASHNHVSLAPPVVGGAGAVEGAPSSVNFSSLGRREVFDLYLNGALFQGQIKDSTLYLRLFHPSTGQSINDLRVIITILQPKSEGSRVVVWDRALYDEAEGCYLYPLGRNSLTPGDYLLYIDVGQFQTIKLPLAVTQDKQVIAWIPRYEGMLKDSTVYMRLYHPVTLVPIKDMPVRITVVNASTQPGNEPEVVLVAPFPYNEEVDAYAYNVGNNALNPGAYMLYIDLAGFHTIALPIIVTPSGTVVPGWR
jgi:hypothetical protein